MEPEETDLAPGLARVRQQDQEAARDLMMQLYPLVKQQKDSKQNRTTP